jgi:hypothetical protein
MSKTKFEAKFDLKTEEIIGQFKKEINPIAWSDAANRIDAIEARMERHKKKYIDKHYWTQN